MPEIGRHIADYRKKAACTQEQLAGELHVTRQTVSSWENGRTLPDVETLANVAAALGVSVEELIYGKRADPGLNRVFGYRKIALIAGASAMGTLLLELTAASLDWSLSVLDPLIWMCFAVQMLSLAAMTRRLPARSRKMRHTLLLCGTVPVAVYLLAVLAAIPGSLPLAAAVRDGMCRSAWLFLFCGAAFFFGLDRQD